MKTDLTKDQGYLSYLAELEQQNGFPAGLLASQMKAESSGNPDAVGPQTRYGKALGAFQILPSTAQDLGIDPTDPMQAAQGAAQYLSQNIKKFGDVPSALAAYNWGPGALARNGIENAPEETRNYVGKILAGVGNFMVPSANAAEPQDAVPAGFVPEPSPLAGVAQQAITPVGMPATVPDGTSTPFQSDYSPNAVTQAPIPDVVPAGFIPADQVPQQGALAKVGDAAMYALKGTAHAFIDPIANAGAIISGKKSPTLSDIPDLLLPFLPGAPGLKAEGRSALADVAPLETNMAKIDLNSPIKPYENLGYQAGPAPTSAAADKATSSSVADLVSTQKQIDLLKAQYSSVSGKADPAGRQLISELENKAQTLRDSLIGQPQPPVQTATPTATSTPSAEPLVKPTINTVDDQKAYASSLYKKADELGGQLTPEFTNKFADDAQRLAPQTAAGKKIWGENGLTKLVDRVQTLKNEPLSFHEVQEIDEGLSHAVSENVDKFGKLDKLGKNIFDLQTNFRNMVDNAGEGQVVGGRDGFDALKQARGAWSDYVKSADIQRIIDNGSPTVTDNPATAIRSGFRALIKNPARFNRYTPEQQALIRKAAASGLKQEFLRAAGSRLISIIAGASAGGLDGGIVGMAANTIVGTGARKLAGNIQAKRGAKVIDSIIKK